MTGVIDSMKRKIGVPIKDETGRSAPRAPDDAAPDTAKEDDGKEDDGKSLAQRLEEALRTIYDPEIPVNIYDLGLVYTVDVNEAEGSVYVEMTLTAPGCPVAQTFPGMVESRLYEVPGVEEVTVKLVWDPPWTQDRMSEAARVQLGMF